MKIPPKVRLVVLASSLALVTACSKPTPPQQPSVKRDSFQKVLPDSTKEEKRVFPDIAWPLG